MLNPVLACAYVVRANREPALNASCAPLATELPNALACLDAAVPQPPIALTRLFATSAAVIRPWLACCNVFTTAAICCGVGAGASRSGLVSSGSICIAIYGTDSVACGRTGMIASCWETVSLCVSRSRSSISSATDDDSTPARLPCRRNVRNAPGFVVCELLRSAGGWCNDGEPGMRARIDGVRRVSRACGAVRVDGPATGSSASMRCAPKPCVFDEIDPGPSMVFPFKG
ncbi:hypothetical protein [Burkholderia humptydooensis]|uniref:hypothetical protein n=1 Tax=Burkholderia humptydooensis TaxID=430531 RepID=UPI001E5B6232|nr:hypothetical protein [Burkholderia humptydooensis]